MGGASASGDAMRNKALPKSIETRDIGTKWYLRPLGDTPHFIILQDTPES